MAKEKRFSHLAWLKKTGEKLTTSDGKTIVVWELVVDDADAATWKTWAKHFREHYCLDSMIDELRDGTTYSRAEYLRQLVFPDAKKDWGPAVRTGDFTEILLSDLMEEHFQCWVPRTRYANKEVRNESPKGVDVLGLNFVNADFSPSPKDILLTFEGKAQLSGRKPLPRLQDAIDDSSKDAFRKGETLNAIKRRLIEQGKRADSHKVKRFQDALGRPYVEQSGAAAFFCRSVYDAAHICQSSSCKAHKNISSLLLLVIRSNNFMKLVHALYERAEDEA
jgi:hypothetical protein